MSGKHGGRDRRLKDHHSCPTQEAESREREREMEVGSVYKFSKPTSSDVLPPARLPLLNFLRQHCHLGSYCSNACGSRSLGGAKDPFTGVTYQASYTPDIYITSQNDSYEVATKVTL